MTLAAQLKEATFWHESICLKCGNHREPEAILDECEDCGGSMADAQELTAFVERLSEEAEDTEGN